MRTIIFYLPNEAYGQFSNFAAFPLVLDGRIWPTSEHYYQAQKFRGTLHEETIRNAPSPAKAAGLGRSRDFKVRSDWDDVKVDVMRTALQAKFEQHPIVASLLISTTGAKLVERSNTDSFWADGPDGNGKNMLGVLLMELRQDVIGS